MSIAAEQQETKGATVNRTLVLVLVCVAQFMVILDVSVVNVALPAIRRSLHFSQQDLQWVVSAYTLTFAGFLMLGGRAADLLGRRRVFMVGLTIFTVASLLGSVAQSDAMLVFFRGLQGLGGAIVSPATLAILSTTFTEGGARNRALGIWGSMAAVGGSVGVILGGVLTETLSWRAILFINVPIGLAALLFARRSIPESRGQMRHRHYDVAGALTLTVGLIAIVYAIVQSDANGWGSATTLGVMACGFALLAVFVAIEARFALAPLVPLGIFRSRTLTGANTVMFLLGCTTFAMWFFLSLYLQQVLGYSAIEAGLSFLPLTVGLVVGAQVASRLATRVGVRPLLTGGMLLLAVGMALFSRIPAHGSFLGDVLGPSIVAAAGFGLTFVPATIAAVGGVAPSEAGLASGLINTSRQMGGAVGLAVLSTLATNRTSKLLGQHESLHAALTGGYHRAFEVACVFALVGATAAYALIRPNPRRSPDELEAAPDQAPEQPGEPAEALV